jgi:hypothetical protein
MTQRRVYRQIVIRYIAVPTSERPFDDEVDWIYQCLGLGDERDDVGKLVFRAVIKSSKSGLGISSRDIMQFGEVTQAAIIYHLNLFQRTGLVVKEGRNYFLRAPSLEQTILEMEADTTRRFDQLKKISKKIDGY